MLFPRLTNGPRFSSLPKFRAAQKVLTVGRVNTFPAFTRPLFTLSFNVRDVKQVPASCYNVDFQKRCMALSAYFLEESLCMTVHYQNRNPAAPKSSLVDPYSATLTATSLRQPRSPSLCQPLSSDKTNHAFARVKFFQMLKFWRKALRIARRPQPYQVVGI